MKTALILPVAEAESIVGEERWLYDPSCALGMPAHITIVTPFAPPPVSCDMISELEQIVGSFPVMDLRFAAVGTFPHTVYVKPEPGDAIIRLTQAIISRWPKWLPYGGIHAEIIPHLTVADRIEDQGLLDDIAVFVAGRLPIEARVRAAWLMQQDEDDIWRRLEVLPFRNG